MSAARLSYELKRKIDPLLRLQSSDNAGERANASAAVGRLLKNHGLDWHDLTEVLLAEPQVVSEPTPDATTWKRSSGAVELPRGQLIALLNIVEERTAFLPLKSREFLTSLRSRSSRPMIHLSEKQWAWLQDLLQATGV